MLTPFEQTVELGQLRLRRKHGLQFSQRQSGGQTWYMLEDAIAGKFFQIGLAQYTFLSLLNGERTVNKVIQKSAVVLREHALDDKEISQLCKWAIDSDLVESQTGNNVEYHLESEKELGLKKGLRYLNPISFRIPLFRPDNLVAGIEKVVGWLVSSGGAMLWLIVVCFAAYLCLIHWSELFTDRISTIGPSDFFWLGLSWLGLKLIHETCHAIVCKRYGGCIHSSGLLFLLLIPLPYVDVTSSWRFASKWHRILTSAAGMIGELFVAALATILWTRCEPGPLQYHLGNLILTATFHTIAFNANPLMRFDGYYMLADWLEIPNLYTHGRSFVKSFFTRLFFGTQKASLHEMGWRRRFVQAYGVLSILWFVFVSAGLTLAASNFIHGIGLVMALIAVSLWILIPLIKLGKYFVFGSELETPNRFRFVFSTSVVLAAVIGFLACPAPSVVTAPLVVDYQPLNVVRARTQGFVDQILVANGDQVQNGQLLFKLKNEELNLKLESLRIDIRIARRQIDTLLTAGSIAKLKLETAALRSMESQRHELQEMISGLEVRASESGAVIFPELKNRSGTWMNQGDTLLAIGNQEQIRAIALVRQSDIEWVDESNPVEIRLDGIVRDDLVGHITAINPRAREDVPHEAFAASNGGPLPVTFRRDESNDSSYVLCQPRIPVEIKLDSDSELPTGQIGQLLLRGRNENMGEFLGERIARLFWSANDISHGF